MPPEVLSVILWRPLTAVLSRCSLDADSFAAGLRDGQRRAFEAVRQLAWETGAQVCLVGGPVRDALLGVPALDLDFAVEGDASTLARSLSERLPGCLILHARFGTATVSAEGLRVDLVTARRESYRRPGALPEVTPGSIGDDLSRRDFSVNAMALPLSGGEDGLLDPLGGLADLEAGVVRSLHPLSFADDPTRMMRAVRYEQRFGFRIDSETQAAMAHALSAGYMNAVSGDRWRHELERILDEANPVAPLSRAVELGLLAGLHPAFARLSADAEGGLQRLEVLRQAWGEVQPDICLAALFSPVIPSEAEGVIQRLRLSGRRADLAHDTIRLKQSEPQFKAGGLRPSQLARMLEGLEPAAVSAWAELTADEVVADALRRYATELKFVKPRLSGAALLGMGVTEGPMVGEILACLREARLDGTVKTEADEMALAQDCMARALTELAK